MIGSNESNADKKFKIIAVAHAHHQENCNEEPNFESDDDAEDEEEEEEDDEYNSCQESSDGEEASEGEQAMRKNNAQKLVNAIDEHFENSIRLWDRKIRNQSVEMNKKIDKLSIDIYQVKINLNLFYLKNIFVYLFIKSLL